MHCIGWLSVFFYALAEIARLAYIDTHHTLAYIGVYYGFFNTPGLQERPRHILSLGQAPGHTTHGRDIRATLSHARWKWLDTRDGLQGPRFVEDSLEC